MTGNVSIKMRIFLGVLAVAVLMGGYAWLSHNQHVRNPDDTTIPTASQLIEGIKNSFQVHPRTQERWVVEDTKATLKRLFLGLAYGISGSIIIGLAMGCFKKIEAFLLPLLTLLAKVPPTAAFAVFFVMVGTDIELYITMIAFGVLPTLSQSIYLSVKDVPAENLYKAATLGSSKGEIIWNVIFSQIRPKIIDGVRLQIGPAMVYLIAAEMIVGDVGFGYRIRLQSRLLDMSVVYPYLVLLAAFGFLMDLILKYTVRFWCPWYTKRAG